MEKTKLTMEPGVRYRGSAWINEFGEIHFQPEQKGSRPSNLRVVYQQGETTIYESRRFFRISVQIPKTNDMLQKVLDIFGKASVTLLRYLNTHK